MFNNPRFDRVRQLFVDQFEPDGGSFLYRKSMKGAPVRVTETERDEFIAAFNQRLRYVTWSILPATIILIGLLAWLIPDADSRSADIAMWAGFAVILVPFWRYIYGLGTLLRANSNVVPRKDWQGHARRFAK